MAIEWLDEPTADGYGTVTVGTWGGYLVQIMPMIFNDRLVLTPESSPLTYHHGWCYPKGGYAVLHAFVWDPETQAEPAGYLKRVMPFVRRAGARAQAGAS